MIASYIYFETTEVPKITVVVSPLKGYRYCIRSEYPLLPEMIQEMHENPNGKIQ